VAQSAVRLARAKGIRVGLLRPISLYPFPERRLTELASQVRGLLVVELNAGQMVEDVRRSVAGRAPVAFYGRMGGVVPMPEDVLAAIQAMPISALQADGPRHIAL
jgi:2-oxoglutarate ferredoxin oxidoreductase subunit alpha